MTAEHADRDITWTPFVLHADVTLDVTRPLKEDLKYTLHITAKSGPGGSTHHVGSQPGDAGIVYFKVDKQLYFTPAQLKNTKKVNISIECALPLAADEADRVPAAVELVYVLYSNRENATGDETVELLAYGLHDAYTLLASLSGDAPREAIRMDDVDRAQQAVVTMDGAPYRAMNARMNRRVVQERLLVPALFGVQKQTDEYAAMKQPWIELARKAQSALMKTTQRGERPKDIFSSFTSLRGEELPIFAYLALSHKLAEITPTRRLATPAVTIPLFQHWAELASVFVFRYPGVRTSNSIEEDCALLNEFLTVIFRGLLYTPDNTRRVGETGSRINPARAVLTDQWVPLLMFPTLDRVGYDCEDGALVVKQIFSVLMALGNSMDEDSSLLQQTTNSACKTLRRIVATAQQYTPFFTIGQLKTARDAYTPHAYVILLPTSSLIKGYTLSGSVGSTATYDINASSWAPSAGVYPPMIVEATQWLAMPWTPAALADEDAEVNFHNAYSVNRAFASVASSGGVDHATLMKRCARVIKTKTPVRVVDQLKLYGEIYAMVTCFADQYHTDDVRFEHFVTMKSPGTADGVYGVCVGDLLSGDSSIVMRSILRVTTNDIKTGAAHIYDMLSDYPTCRLPAAPAKPPLWLQTLDFSHLQKRPALVYIGRSLKAEQKEDETDDPSSDFILKQTIMAALKRHAGEYDVDITAREAIPIADGVSAFAVDCAFR